MSVETIETQKFANFIDFTLLQLNQSTKHSNSYYIDRKSNIQDSLMMNLEDNII